MGETNRFNATLGVVNAPQASEAWPYIKDGQPVPEPLRTAVGDYIGAGNYWITNQDEFVPVGYTKDAAGNFIKQGSEPVPPTDPLQSFIARQRVSQNCAWFLITPQEGSAVLAKMGKPYHDYIAFYTPGGTGALGINERPDAASPSGYVFVNAAGGWSNDVMAPEPYPAFNRGADKRVEEIGAAQPVPRTAPPPVDLR